MGLLVHMGCLIATASADSEYLHVPNLLKRILKDTEFKNEGKNVELEAVGDRRLLGKKGNQIDREDCPKLPPKIPFFAAVFYSWNHFMIFISAIPAHLAVHHFLGKKSDATWHKVLSYIVHGILLPSSLRVLLQLFRLSIPTLLSNYWVSDVYHMLVTSLALFFVYQNQDNIKEWIGNEEFLSFFFAISDNFFAYLFYVPYISHLILLVIRLSFIQTLVISDEKKNK